MTAVTEQILDTAKRLGETSPHGRLCPPFLACLDELPSTAPIPTLSTRMANERALGLSFILAAQTWRQFVVCYGEDEARTIYGLSNNLVVFGGGKDIRFYQELSDLIGGTTMPRSSYSRSERGLSRSWSPDHLPILDASELRRIESARRWCSPRCTTRSSRTCTAASTATAAGGCWRPSSGPAMTTGSRAAARRIRSRVKTSPAPAAARDAQVGEGHHMNSSSSSSPRLEPTARMPSTG